MATSDTHRSPFFMLSELYADPVMNRVWSEGAFVEAWLRVEAALAWAQAENGVFEASIAEALEAALVLDHIDFDRLWHETRIVGYPIFPLIRQISERVPPAAAGRLHYGATTQDIMDSGIALQIKAAIARLRELLYAMGDALAEAADSHRTTVLAARTHNQQAVPTTLGAKWAVYLDEVGRQLLRLEQMEPRVCRVSLFGAGGTSAALGPTSAAVRAAMARRLGLEPAEIPWHVSRDSLVEYVAACASLAHTAARFAREVVNLSRTEIGEILEPGGHLRGASSTMPQKANPIVSEAVIGIANLVRGLVSPGYAAMVVEHERAAGEWQIEWDAIPRASCLTAAALALVVHLIPRLRVFPERMLHNLDHDGGLIMSEAYMIRLAATLGRSTAHDVVYEAARRARREGKKLESVLQTLVPSRAWAQAFVDGPIEPKAYLGEAEKIVDAALARWRQLRQEGLA